MYLIPAIGFSLCYGAAASAVTLAIDEVAKLLANDTEASDFMGFSVAVDGDTAQLGAYGEDDLGSEAGAAYLFTRDASGIWNEQYILLTSDGLDYGYLGGSGTKAIGISGSTVMPGAMFNDTLLGTNSGAANIFSILPTTDGPDIALAPSALDFGDVMVGQSAQQLVTVSNIGSAELTLLDISLVNGVEFTQTNDCPPSPLPAEACQIAVTFTPTVDGVLTDELTILSDDPDQPTASVTLSGNGVTLLPDLTVTGISTPRTLTAGKIATLGVTIANQGSADAPGGYWVSLYLAGSLEEFRLKIHA